MPSKLCITSIIFNVLLIVLLIFYNKLFPETKNENLKNDSIIEIKRTDPYVEGMVPNKETAIKIAEAIWLQIYGNDILNEKPYYAKLLDSGIWVVTGTLHSDLGGVASIQIQKQDGKVLKVVHTK